jgi:hypothetical protein
VGVALEPAPLVLVHGRAVQAQVVAGLAEVDAPEGIQPVVSAVHDHPAAVGREQAVVVVVNAGTGSDPDPGTVDDPDAVVPVPSDQILEGKVRAPGELHGVVTLLLATNRHRTGAVTLDREVGAVGDVEAGVDARFEPEDRIEPVHLLDGLANVGVGREPHC